MQKHSTHKSELGFTLIELVIAVAVIGILVSVAVLGYNQYKVRAYDAHSKQALRDILLQCNAFWLDHDASQVCTHATVAEVYVASDEIVLKFPAEDLPDLPGGSQGNFCASAQHESSPNTYSIDSASLISSGSDCSGTSGSVQTASVLPAQTFATYKPPETACGADGKAPGAWTAVDSEGRLAWYTRNMPANPIVSCNCMTCDSKGSKYLSKEFTYRCKWCEKHIAKGHKLIYVGPRGKLGPPDYGVVVKRLEFLTEDGGKRYNFATGMWCDRDLIGCEDFSGGSASEQPKQSITTWCGMPVCCNYTKGMPGRADHWVCSDGGSAYRSEKLIGCGPAGCPGGPRGHPDHR